MMKEKTDLAQTRTKWAEDRTVLANERTFSSWMRTGLSSVALGLGVHAIFGKSDPTWAAKSVSTVFIIVGMIIFWFAARASTRVLKRLDTHATQSVLRRNLNLISGLFTFAAFLLCIVLWMI